MKRSNDELQLEAIQYLSDGAGRLFFDKSHYVKTITSVNNLIKSEFSIITTNFPDRYNDKNHFKSSYVAQGKVQSYKIEYFQGKADSKQFLSHLINAKTEFTAEPKNLINNVLPDGAQTLLISQTECFVVPFFYLGKFVGALTYFAEQRANIKSSFPAMYAVIESLFIHQYKTKLKNWKVNTYQTVLDLMPQRVFWKNRQSVYLGCNQAFANDANLEHTDNIIGVTDFDIFPSEAELYRSDDANTMATRQHLIGSEEPQTHHDSSTIWLRTSKRPIITEDDTVTGLVGTYDDISELKNVQEELKLAKNKLEERVIERTKELSQTNGMLESAVYDLKSTQHQLVESEKMAALGNLVAGIAHEINTPIGVAVTGASHLEEMAMQLKSYIESGEVVKSTFIKRINAFTSGTDIILRNLIRASDLVKNFKMIAVDQTKDDQREINLYQYLTDVVSAMAPKTAKKNLTVNVSGEKTFYLVTYPGAVAQIFTNLVDNTLIHAFSNMNDGNINIHFNVTDTTVNIAFEDNGKGILPKNVEKVFEPFYTTNRSGGGSGLGLSIIYNIVTQKLSGSIECLSDENKGTQFIISLPLN